jgi:hypothetical protein
VEHDLFGKPVSTFPDHALRRLLLCRDQLAVDQAFGDLDGVQRCALAQVVGNDPHRQPVLDGGVLVYPYRVLRPMVAGLVRPCIESPN